MASEESWLQDFERRLAAVERLLAAELSAASLSAESGHSWRPAAWTDQKAVNLDPPGVGEGARTLELLRQPDASVSEACVSEDTSTLREELGRADSYTLTESVWDASLLVGLGVLDTLDSVCLVFLVALNAFAQSWFCFIVLSFMTDDPLSSDVMDGLLRFRSGPAHSVLFADWSMKQSLTDQLCGSDRRVPYASWVADLLDSLRGYDAAGYKLSLIAFSCWLAMMLKELFNINSFYAAIRLKWERSAQTGLGLGDDTLSDATSSCSASGLGYATGSDRAHAQPELLGISAPRFATVVCFIVLPRVCVALALLFTGTKYLCATLSLSDLVLNTMALGFIIDIDELFFASFAPRHAKALLRRLRPLPLPAARRRQKYGSGFAALKLSMLIGSLILVYFWLLDPLNEKARQGIDLLCSGETSFVYAVNPVTNIVEAASSFQKVLSISEQELAVLQLAQPSLRTRHSWSAPDEVLQLRKASPATDQNGNGLAFVLPDGVLETPKDEDLVAIADLSLSSVRGVVDSLACEDSSSLQQHRGVRLLLRRLTGGGAAACANLTGPLQDLCRRPNMTALRAVCPVACGCAEPYRPGAAFFAAPALGCPAMCESALPAVMEANPVACRDVSAESFLSYGWLQAYIRSAFDYIFSKKELRSAVSWKLSMVAGSYLHIPSNDTERLGDFVNATQEALLNGSWLETVLRGTWEVSVGVPHPRGLTGCSFWSSWEVATLIGVDFCEPGAYRTLRAACPESCRCVAGMAECPRSCASSPGGGPQPFPAA